MTVMVIPPILMSTMLIFSMLEMMFVSMFNVVDG